MISIIDKEKCCGCNACGDICNQHAITFHLDREGFWHSCKYPWLIFVV